MTDNDGTGNDIHMYRRSPRNCHIFKGRSKYARESILEVRQGIAGPISDTDMGGFALQPIQPLGQTEKKEDNELK